MPFACMFDIAKVKWQIHSRPSVCRRHSAYFNPCDTMHNGNATHYVYVLLVFFLVVVVVFRFLSFCVFFLIWNLFVRSGTDCCEEKGGRYKHDRVWKTDITWKNSCTFHTIHCHVLDTSCEWILFFSCVHTFSHIYAVKLYAVHSTDYIYLNEEILWLLCLVIFASFYRL